MKFRKTATAAALLFLIIGTFGPMTLAQEKKVDTAKLYADIAGGYEFFFEDQYLKVVFWVDEGKLLGAPEGQEMDYAEIMPVDLELMKFETTAPDGQYYEIEFGKDEDGKIAKCNLTTQGYVIEGVRVKK